MKKQIRERRGFTLVELLIVLALLGVFLTMGMSIFISSLHSQKNSYTEYDIQNKLRLVAAQLDDTVNEASAIFAMPQDFFEESKMTEGWDYYGISNDGPEPGTGTQLLSYVYDAESGTHNKKVLIEAPNGSYFKLLFTQPINETTGEPAGEKFIGFRIEILKEGKSEGYVLDTELEGKNSNQVIFRSTTYKPATCIAVKSAGKLGETAQLTFVHFVLDISGSMQLYNLEGRQRHPNRIGLLKDATKKIIDDYSKEPNVFLVFYPFNFTANFEETINFDEARPNGETYYTYTSHPIYSQKENQIGNDFGDGIQRTAIKDFNSAKSYVDGLVAEGGTNVADALRRVRFKIELINNQFASAFYKKNVRINHYLIVLMDGNPENLTLFQKQIDNTAGIISGSPLTSTNPSGDYIMKQNDGNLTFPINHNKDTKYREVWVYYGPENQRDPRAYIDTNYPYPLYTAADVSGNIEYPYLRATLYSAYRYTPAGPGDNFDSESRRGVQNWALREVCEPLNKTIGIQDCFVIGFSSVEEQLQCVEYLGKCLGIPDSKFETNVIKFTDPKMQLDKVFMDIKKSIMDNEWLIKGPDFN